MQAYNKAIVAILGGLVSLASALGLPIPEQINEILLATAPVITAVLVYFIPNKTATPSS